MFQELGERNGGGISARGCRCGGGVTGRVMDGEEEAVGPLAGESVDAGTCPLPLFGASPCH